MNDYLTGANTNLSDAFRHILDRLGNATVHGNNLAADDPAAARSGSRSSCSATAAAPSSR